MGLPGYAGEVKGKWTREGGARFVRQMTGGRWTATYGPQEWVPVTLAAALMGVTITTIAKWRGAGLIVVDRKTGPMRVRLRELRKLAVKRGGG